MARRLDEELSFSLEIKKTAAGRAPLLPTLAIENSHPFLSRKMLCGGAARSRSPLLPPQTDAVDGPSARIAALAAEHLAAATASRIPATSAKMIVGIITMR